MKFIEVVHYGQVMPRFYGVAWRRDYMDAVVAMPLPFNVIARWLRRFYVLMVVGRIHKGAELREEYMRGFRDGQLDALRRRNS